ncbi:MAG: 30S ribosome-binding factor RbfA [Acidimicrobiia bacterium]|nr:30S ribosome-binding factor RbfA [Acidimicrobiia bacterium]
MSRSTSPRMRRVNAILLEVVAEEVAGLKDPRIGFVTVTGVDTSPDLRNAIVYFSVLGTDEERSSTIEALDSAASRVRTAVGHRIRIKYTPKLAFRVDESIERGIYMSNLLREIAVELPADRAESDDV